MASCVICENETRSGAQLCRICADRTTGSLDISSISGAMRVAAAVNAERRRSLPQLAPPADTDDRADRATDHDRGRSEAEPPVGNPLRSAVAGTSASAPDVARSRGADTPTAPPVPTPQAAASATPPATASRAATPSTADARPRWPAHGPSASPQRSRSPRQPQRVAGQRTRPPRLARKRARRPRVTAALLLLVILGAGMMGGALVGINVRLSSTVVDGSEAIAEALAARQWLLSLPRIGLVVAVVVGALALDWSLTHLRPGERTVTYRRVCSVLAFAAACTLLIAASTVDAATIGTAQRANVWIGVACAMLIVTAAENFRYVYAH